MSCFCVFGREGDNTEQENKSAFALNKILTSVKATKAKRRKIFENIYNDFTSFSHLQNKILIDKLRHTLTPLGRSKTFLFS